MEKPNKKTSPIWKHFGFEPDSSGKPKNEDKPICKLYMQAGSGYEGIEHIEPFGSP